MQSVSKCLNIVPNIFAFLFPQGESAEQNNADDCRQSVHLLLAHTNETRLWEQRHTFHHQTKPVGHRKLHPTVSLLLLWRQCHWIIQHRRHATFTRPHHTLRTQHGGVPAGTAASASTATTTDSALDTLWAPYLIVISPLVTWPC